MEHDLYSPESERVRFDYAQKDTIMSDLASVINESVESPSAHFSSHRLSSLSESVNFDRVSTLEMVASEVELDVQDGNLSALEILVLVAPARAENYITDENKASVAEFFAHWRPKDALDLLAREVLSEADLIQYVEYFMSEFVAVMVPSTFVLALSDRRLPKDFVQAITKLAIHSGYGSAFARCLSDVARDNPIVQIIRNDDVLLQLVLKTTEDEFIEGIYFEARHPLYREGNNTLVGDHIFLMRLKAMPERVEQIELWVNHLVKETNDSMVNIRFREIDFKGIARMLDEVKESGGRRRYGERVIYTQLEAQVYTLFCFFSRIDELKGIEAIEYKIVDIGYSVKALYDNLASMPVVQEKLMKKYYAFLKELGIPIYHDAVAIKHGVSYIKDKVDKDVTTFLASEGIWEEEEAPDHFIFTARLIAGLHDSGKADELVRIMLKNSNARVIYIMPRVISILSTVDGINTELLKECVRICRSEGFSDAELFEELVFMVDEVTPIEAYQNARKLLSNLPLSEEDMHWIGDNRFGMFEEALLRKSVGHKKYDAIVAALSEFASHTVRLRFLKRNNINQLISAVEKGDVLKAYLIYLHYDFINYLQIPSDEYAARIESSILNPDRAIAMYGIEELEKDHAMQVRDEFRYIVKIKARWRKFLHTIRHTESLNLLVQNFRPLELRLLLDMHANAVMDMYHQELGGTPFDVLRNRAKARLGESVWFVSNFVRLVEIGFIGQRLNEIVEELIQLYETFQQYGLNIKQHDIMSLLRDSSYKDKIALLQRSATSLSSAKPDWYRLASMALEYVLHDQGENISYGYMADMENDQLMDFFRKRLQEILLPDRHLVEQRGEYLKREIASLDDPTNHILTYTSYIHDTSVSALVSILQTANLAGEFLGTGSRRTDVYPGYVDTVHVDDLSEGFQRLIQRHFDHGVHILYNTSIVDGVRIEEPSSGYEGHTLIPVGISNLAIEGIVFTESVDDGDVYEIKEAIVRSEMYIPIFNAKGELIFSPDEFEELYDAIMIYKTPEDVLEAATVYPDEYRSTRNTNPVMTVAEHMNVVTRLVEDRIDDIDITEDTAICLKLAAKLHDIGKLGTMSQEYENVEEARKILDRIRGFSSEQKRRVLLLIKHDELLGNMLREMHLSKDGTSYIRTKKFYSYKDMFDRIFDDRDLRFALMLLYQADVRGIGGDEYELWEVEAKLSGLGFPVYDLSHYQTVIDEIKTVGSSDNDMVDE